MYTSLHGQTCKDCGKPIHWAEQGTEDGGAWYHDNLIDFWVCPAPMASPTEPATTEV